MTVEIERKFLVNSNDFKKEASKSYSIKQGFLNSHEERTVRVRLKNDKGYLTIKGKSSEDGLVRFEWETEITKFEAEQLLTLCEDSIIDKIRYEVNFGNHTFEIDEFFGENDGLVIAEVELQKEDQKLNLPKWIEKDVTNQNKYYNYNLAINPYISW